MPQGNRVRDCRQVPQVSPCDTDIGGPQPRPHPEPQVLWVNSEQPGIERTMVKATQHEPVSCIIATSFSPPNQVRRLKKLL
jgi:hypothetical protein